MTEEVEYVFKAAKRQRTGILFSHGIPKELVAGRPGGTGPVEEPKVPKPNYQALMQRHRAVIIGAGVLRVILFSVGWLASGPGKPNCSDSLPDCGTQGYTGYRHRPAGLQRRPWTLRDPSLLSRAALDRLMTSQPFELLQ